MVREVEGIAGEDCLFSMQQQSPVFLMSGLWGWVAYHTNRHRPITNILVSRDLFFAIKYKMHDFLVTTNAPLNALCSTLFEVK